MNKNPESVNDQNKSQPQTSPESVFGSATGIEALEQRIMLSATWVDTDTGDPMCVPDFKMVRIDTNLNRFALESAMDRIGIV